MTDTALQDRLASLRERGAAQRVPGLRWQLIEALARRAAGRLSSISPGISAMSRGRWRRRS